MKTATKTKPDKKTPRKRRPRHVIQVDGVQFSVTVGRRKKGPSGNSLRFLPNIQRMDGTNGVTPEMQMLADGIINAIHEKRNGTHPQLLNQLPVTLGSGSLTLDADVVGVVRTEPSPTVKGSTQIYWRPSPSKEDVEYALSFTYEDGESCLKETMLHTEDPFITLRNNRFDYRRVVTVRVMAGTLPKKNPPRSEEDRQKSHFQRTWTLVGSCTFQVPGLLNHTGTRHLKGYHYVEEDLPPQVPKAIPRDLRTIILLTILSLVSILFLLKWPQIKEFYNL